MIVMKETHEEFNKKIFFVFVLCFLVVWTKDIVTDILPKHLHRDREIKDQNWYCIKDFHFY